MEAMKTVKLVRLFWPLILGLSLVLGALWALTPPSVAHAQDGEAPWMRVNYRDDWVGGNYTAGHTIWITVTNSSDDVKGTAAISSTDGGGWGVAGFETRSNHWSSGQPDIAPGDRVYFQADDGYTHAITVGTITGKVDVSNDSISGTVSADFAQTLDLRCDVWVESNGPEGVDTDVYPDGSTPYACAWDPISEWDLLPGQDVAVMYSEPDGDRVINVFQEPAPNLRVDKWVDGNGAAAPGGPVVFNIRYQNQGQGAGEAILTDTLPSNTTYAGDSSGFHAFVSSGVITWNLGSVPPYTLPHQFQLVLTNTADSGDILNAVDIGTPYDTNSKDNHAEASVQIADESPDLRVNKNANPGDPAPGQLFRYEIDYGNNGWVASGPVWLTDTLPASTTFVSWTSENNYSLWTAVVTSGGQVVLHAPALPGNFGDRIYLTLQLDGAVGYGTQLTNTVEITTAGDSNPGNNQDTNTAQASAPRTNTAVEKSWGSGSLVPGGEIVYRLDYGNGGNAVAPGIVLTDTLPDGTTFITSTFDLGWGVQIPFSPDIQGRQLIWDVGDLAVNAWPSLQLRLRVDPDTIPGTVLTNCATVSALPGDENPGDNTDCAAQTVRGHGPNLRVSKWHQWRGNNNDQLHYEITFENVGDGGPIPSVVLTDTYPLSTTLAGGPGWDYWRNMGWTNNYTDHQLIFRIDELDPGATAHIQFDVTLDDAGARPRWYTNTAKIDTPPDGDTNPTDNTYVDVAFKTEVEQVELWVGQDREMWGRAAPGAPVTVTTASALFTTNADGGGNWKINNVGTITPGDVITVEAGGGLLPVIFSVPDPFTAQASSNTGAVWGRIGGAANQTVQVQGNWPSGYQEVPTDASGAYTATYSSIPRGGDGEVRYQTQVDYADVIFHHNFKSPDLMLRVNYADDWVETQYPAGRTIWITVTNSAGTFTAMGTTESLPQWGGQSGFATWQDSVNWSPSQPDIAPGDWVYGALDNGYTSTVHVGAISGHLDLADDTITGTVSASFTQALALRCDIWVENGPNGIETDVYPDGSDVYKCDFGGQWNILPGQNVAVTYSEPDGDQVINIFREPAPHVKLQKQGNGSPAEGGNFAFRISYENNGDGNAQDVVITDTLLYGMTYLTDTSGFTHTGSGAPGDPLVWQLGTLTASINSGFEVFVQITAAVGEQITNTAQIATSNPYDEYRPPEYNNGWGKESWWSAQVEASDTHLKVDKNSWTGDPTPGYDTVFAVNPCNKGSTASSQVTLTDTLHLSTTLLYWWGEQPGWTEVFSDSHTLVVSNPTLPSGACSQVYVRARLDETAWPDMPISNTVVITASNDLEGSDNEATWSGRVGSPHTNLNIGKSWNWGQLVPGGQLRYNINYNNNGNLPVASTIRITDTFPSGTTFNTWNFGGRSSITLVKETADYAVWEVGGLDNGYGDGFEVVLNVDGDAEPGLVLTNTAEIERQPVEDNYDDNVSTSVETLLDHGPNLRVRKWGDWHGDRAGHAWYNLAVENVGDQGIAQAVVTDTYPLSMTMEGNVNTDWSRVAGYTHDPTGHWFTATLENLDVGYRLEFNFNTTMPEPVALGAILTNTATVQHVSGDAYPDDDSDVVALSTGPDLYVEKTLLGGEPLPGRIITFSLRYGNAQPGHTWWWNTQGNAWITDTLPTGLEYITSTQRWCGGSDCPYIVPTIVDNQLVFNVGSQKAGAWNEIYLTARVGNTVQGGTALTNNAEIATDDPANDVEPNYDNNTSSYAVTMTGPSFVVTKTYTSSAVAGTVVTYTLAVSNTGNQAGSGVVLSDTLPANLDYGGSEAGTFDGNAVTWTFASIAAGDMATGWFSGTLPCTSSTVIANDDYRVVASTEGAVSPAGAAVSLETISPTVTTGITHTLGAIVAGDTVYFTATASTNGTPLSYQWDFGTGPASGGLTASYVYTPDGSYTAIFTATDTCGNTDTATSSVTVNARPPSSVTIAGPITGVVQSSYIFTATFSPAETTLPITYTWQATDQSLVTHSGGGLTDTISFAWSVTGTKTITVTAANDADIVTATHAITIEASGNRPVYLPIIKKNSQ